MRKIITALIAILPTLSNADFNQSQKLLLMNDMEAWLSSGSSLFNWSGIAQKDISLDPGIESPIEVFANFQKNSFSSEKMYRQKYQRIVGNFASIQKDSYGNPIGVFDVGYLNHLYISGLTRNEAEDIDLSKPIALMCKSVVEQDGDLIARCSMFKSPTRMFSVDYFQDHLNDFALDKVSKIVASNEKLASIMKTASEVDLGSDCDLIDSKNYSYCLSKTEKEVGSRLKRD
ncbi:hypothetical protein P256_00696 [Acinetobacter nectaris CIP 110549]|uniref:Uncharacterized protein n=1 Tax=Acinetobacter nectaris CIP 110549 TaxID=1392540 RepID=V2UY63_9GAMM|nr:hypothetical protein [Acinetobacter nectaris]ESK40249.1 hypothetical protein P256_00696 [Acinetobacter nectaris CIP 110549]